MPIQKLFSILAFVGTALLLDACSGGGSATTGCVTIDQSRSSALPGCGTAAAATDTGNTPTPPKLSSTAPPSITLEVGASATFTIAGGVAPYTVSTTNNLVLAASVSGNTLIITALHSGAGQATVVDKAGTTFSVSVNVTAPPPLFSTAPDTIVVKSGATTSFLVGGGTGPYTVSSSDTSVLTASLSGANLTLTGGAGGAAKAVVVDSTGASITINVTVGTVTSLFTTAPATLTVTAPSTSTYAVGGGKPPYTATSSNPGIATASVAGTALTIAGVTTGRATIYLTDVLGNASTIAVAVGNANDLYTTAPPAVTLVAGAGDSYIVGGGTAPYTVTSSNTSVLTASLAGATMTLHAVIPGNAQVAVSDSAGHTTLVNVTAAPTALKVLDVEPNTATATVGDVLTFRVGGGSPGYQVAVNNPTVLGVTPATVTADGGNFTAKLLTAGATSIVVIDSSGATFPFTVTAGAATPQLRLSPSRFAIAESYLQPITLNAYGGVGPYRAFTSDLQKSSVTVDGSTVTVGMGTAGTHCFPSPLAANDTHQTYEVTITVVDSTGASATSVMVIQDNLPTPTCP